MDPPPMGRLDYPKMEDNFKKQIISHKQEYNMKVVPRKKNLEFWPKNSGVKLFNVT